jgi:hypothetical protein
MPVLLIYFLDSEDILLQGIRGKERGFLFGLDPNQVLSAYGVSFQLLSPTSHLLFSLVHSLLSYSPFAVSYVERH